MAMEPSGIELTASVGMPHDECPGGKPSVKNDLEGRPAEEKQRGTPVGGASPIDQIKSVDELDRQTQAGNVDEIAGLESSEFLDRKLSSGDDVMSMTIECLRSRLLSERSASKAAKLRVRQLAAQVSELQVKLDQAIEDRRKAQVATQEAVMKLKLAESSNPVTGRTSCEVSDRYIPNLTRGSSLSMPRVGIEDDKCSSRPDVSSFEKLSQTNSYGAPVEDEDPNTKKKFPDTASQIEERSAVPVRLRERPTPLKTLERSQGTPQKQDNRVAIENRLRDLWNGISEGIAALAEEKSNEDVEREEIMSWMGQVPTVLQDIIPKKLVSPSHDMCMKYEIEKMKSQDAPVQMVEDHPELSSHIVQEKGQWQGDPKKAAFWHEQFAAQEIVQREWERNYVESQRKLEQFKGNDLNTNRLPKASARHRHHQHAEFRHEANDVADSSSFLRSHQARLAKSKSTLDLPTGSDGRNSEINLPRREEPFVEPDSSTREKPLRHGAGGPHHEAVYMQVPIDPTYLNHSTRMYKDRAAAPSMSKEDVYRSFQPDFRVGQPIWEGTDRGISERHLQAQPGDSEREESCTNSQPGSAHRHQSSHSDSNGWLAVEEYDGIHQRYESNPGLGRRQSYPRHPAALASNTSHTNFERASGSYDDRRYSDESVHGAGGQRRVSFPAAKIDCDLRQQHSHRNGYSSAELILSLGYGPTHDFPQEGSAVQRSPKSEPNKNICDVLRALQVAKTNIQSRVTSTKDQRLLKPGYGMEPSAQYMQAFRQPTSEQIRYSERQILHSQSSRSAF
ncbi:uncharacterized protein [Physcomitrium patens]|uniref:uncharacterized protein isoform X2 n=1 Tax=Physcomitrium patens TaxID=3218 RepID=UPI000D1588AF|nr:uncharacterized protein LOC112277834 isoform X2 [Physcomitrium patens]|eukprot:XP_024366386.1 uncharacterized protein LOC112277834 isoform X2 [Physcomitrella patens]